MATTKNSKIPAVSVATPGEFNGYPVLTLPNPDDVNEPGIQFGVKKLRAFLNNVDAVRAFVAKHHKEEAKADTAVIAQKDSEIERLKAALAAFEKGGVVPVNVGA